MNQRSDSERLAVIESTVERIDLNLFGPDGQGGIFSTLDRRLNSVDRRVSKLENWRSWVIGVSMGVGVVLGGLIQKFLTALAKQ